MASPAASPRPEGEKAELDRMVNEIFAGQSKNVLDDITEIRRFPIRAGSNKGRFHRLKNCKLIFAARKGGAVRASENSGQAVSPSELRELWLRKHPTGFVIDVGLVNYGIDLILNDVVSEMPQLVSRLLVKNKELYGRHDRFRSEASFRINVSIALLVLLITATSLAHIHLGTKVVLMLIELVVAILLFRQGLLRSISARDVIAQAIAIGEVKSAYIRHGEMPESANELRETKQAESSVDETRRDAQPHEETK